MAVKPNRVQAKQVYAYVGTTPTRRVQTLDWASNFTIDSVFELGNAGIVEDSITLVETGITLNSNEWGTTDLEAMIFGIYEQRNVLGTTGNTIATVCVSTRGAGGDWTAPATSDWLQIMRFNANPTTNSAEYVKISDRTYDSAEQCVIFTLDSSYRLNAAAATSDIVTLVNKYTITENTVDADPVHFVLPHRYSTTSTAIMHSIILPRCFTDNLSYRIDTGGASEQNYSLVGEEERMLLGSRREAASVTGSFASYSNATITFTIPRDSLSITGSPYAVYAASNFGTAKVITHTSGQVTVQAMIGSGLGIDSTTQLLYIYTNKNKKGYKVLTNIDSGIGKLTKGYVDILLEVGGTNEEKLTRCTGIDLSIPLTRETIDELGESRSIAKPLEGNLRNEITLTFNRNDLREYAKLLGKETNFDADPKTITEILMTDLQEVKTAKITVKFYNSKITHDSTTLLKTITFNNCNFIGQNSTTPISGASGLELQFSSETLNIVGSGNPPQYS